MNTMQHEPLFTDLTPEQAEIVEGGKAFSLWGSKWNIRKTADPNAPIVGKAFGIVDVDFQVNTGKPIKVGPYTSKYMARIASFNQHPPGFITTIAIKGEGERLRGVPVYPGDP